MERSQNIRQAAVRKVADMTLSGDHIFSDEQGGKVSLSASGPRLCSQCGSEYAAGIGCC